ncbi:MAG: TetR/AcrR family transcriptional regulator [Actinomycetota bacterium]
MKARGTRRPYHMVARAESVAATREQILDAAVETFWSAPTTEIPLDGVASLAGVSLQTLIRHFGSKKGLLAAAVQRETSRVQRQRDEAPAGDVEGIVRVLLNHYEDLGDRVLRVLAEEQRTEQLRELVDIGRATHKAWCERVFASALSELQGVERQRRLAQLVAICDVYTWKLLRRDARLSRRQTELALVELLQALMEAS